MGKDFRFEVQPSIGVARVGDSVSDFYLAPETIGGRPISCDSYGNAVIGDGGKPVFVERYKDAEMRVKRQGARFRVMRYDADDPNAFGREVTVDDDDVASIEWTVHVANKKAAWHNFAELQGDLFYGGSYNPANSYLAQKVPFRNPQVDPADRKGRQALIIDPGPRTLNGRHQRVEFSKEGAPEGYPVSFPSYANGQGPSQGYPIRTLGSAVTDDRGSLVVIGAYGRAGGDEPISSYAGADTWHDDVADGSIVCKLTMKSGDVVQLPAWVIIGSPKFAPEVTNVTTLDDILFDVGVRYQNLDPGLYKNGSYNRDYVASFDDDIQPILSRMASYQWVANTQAMTAAANPSFNVRDPDERNRVNRESLFRQFRSPDTSQQLWAQNGAPAMPLNSGTNSVTNELIVKFSTVTATQYFLLSQWADGKFTNAPRSAAPRVAARNRVDVGNAVGEPMSPGIEVTWSLRNPTLYAQPYQIMHRHDAAYYQKHGLDPMENETEPKDPRSPFVGEGCEPGDLTKRMAIPWQADFFQCTLQYVNFTNPEVNKSESGIPLPPTYYSYWWPPQSPWNVITGGDTAAEQAATGLPAGIQTNYARGINSFVDMITGWKYLGFIHNQTTGAFRDYYPYFVEVERNNARFAMASVAIGGISNVLDPTNVTFMPAWFLRDQNDGDAQLRAVKMRANLVEEEVLVAELDEVPRPITADPQLGLPRNGRVIR